MSRDENIGDPILCESTVFLCEKIAPQNRYKLLDLRGRTDDRLFFIINLPLKLLNILIIRFTKKSLNLNFAKRIYLRRYISWYLKEIDMIIFAGGGIIETEH